MAVRMEPTSKADLYLGRRIGSVEVIKTTADSITFLCNCGESFVRGREAAEFKPPMTCKACHKANISSVMSANRRDNDGNMTRDNTAWESQQFLIFQ